MSSQQEILGFSCDARLCVAYQGGKPIVVIGSTIYPLVADFEARTRMKETNEVVKKLTATPAVVDKATYNTDLVLWPVYCNGNPYCYGDCPLECEGFYVRDDVTTQFVYIMHDYPGCCQ